MKSLDDLSVAGSTVLVRSDFNVPLADGPDGTRVITDDGRIQAGLPTINALRDAGAKVVIVAHLGRPKGEPKPEYSLAPVAARLSDLLGIDVPLGVDITGSQTKALIDSMSAGDVLLLENIRYDTREDSKSADDRSDLAAELAELANFYVSDGFGVVHR